MVNIDRDPPAHLLAKGVGKRRCFFFNKRPAQHREPLVLVMGGRERCESEYFVSRHTFPYYSMEFVVGGRGEAVLNGKAYPLFPGMMFSYGPDTDHKITTDPKFLMTKYFLSFEGMKAAEFLDRAGLPPGQPHDMGRYYAWTRIFGEIVQAGQRVDALGDRLCVLLFEVLFLKLEEIARHREHPHNEAYATYLRIRNFIDENFEKLSGLSEIADEFDAKPPEICHLFKKFSESVTPYQYLLRRKMNLAADLLVTSRPPINEVASRVGIKDALHFSRIFRTMHGHSPRAFIDKKRPQARLSA